MDVCSKDAIRNRVLSALRDKRSSSFSFLGHFLQLEWPTIRADSLVLTMAAGAHCRDSEGRISLSALSSMIDIGLATACRLRTGTTARQATVQLHLQFTGVPPEGTLAMEAAFDGFSTGHALRQSFCHGVVTSGGAPVCHARATFVSLPPPRDASLGSFPWEHAQGETCPPLAESDLDPRERAVFDACIRALAFCDDGHAFLDRFLGIKPEPDGDGAGCDVAIGPIHSNRVGDVHGGLLLGLAATTAQAAAPGHPGLCTLSASFIGPGRGESLRVRSESLQRGRSFATVRTQIRSSGDALVLDAVSSHAR